MLKISRERFLELVDCDPVAGKLYWKEGHPGCMAGKEAGGMRSDNQCARVSLDRTRFKVHRLIWFYVHGAWPREIDHIDRNPANNSINNLRVASRGQNMQNSKTLSTNRAGLKGAHFKKDRQNFVSRICLNGKQMHLGCFDTAEEAHAAYCAAARQHFGEFFNDGVVR